MKSLGMACVLTMFVAMTGWGQGVPETAQQADEAAIKALTDIFADGFMKKNPEERGAIFAENGTLLTPLGVFLQGREAITKEFGPEGESLVVKNTKMKFSNFWFRFITPDAAFVTADITVTNVRMGDKIMPVMGITDVFTAVRQNGKWLIQDERAFGKPLPPPAHKGAKKKPVS